MPTIPEFDKHILIFLLHWWVKIRWATSFSLCYIIYWGISTNTQLPWPHGILGKFSPGIIFLHHLLHFIHNEMELWWMNYINPIKYVTYKSPVCQQRAIIDDNNNTVNVVMNMTWIWMPVAMYHTSSSDRHDEFQIWTIIFIITSINKHSNLE